MKEISGSAREQGVLSRADGKGDNRGAILQKCGEVAKITLTHDKQRKNDHIIAGRCAEETQNLDRLWNSEKLCQGN